MLKKILDMFFKNKTNNLPKNYQGQPKTTINETGSVLHNKIRSASPMSGAFDVVVTGVSFYQMALEKIFGGRSGEGIEVIMQAQIIPYDDNPYDAYAVRIEIEGEIVGHLSRKDARKWRSKMISECFSGAVTCRAKIVWDRGDDKAGSYGVWLDTDLTLSDSNPEKNSALAVSVPTKQSNQIEFLVNELNRFELSNCRVGDEVNLWVADQTKQIFIYRQGADFGEGKIGICPDAVFRVISAAPGCEASIASIYEGGCKIICKLLSKAEMDKREEQMKAVEEKKVQEKQQKLREELEKKYSPKNSIKAIFNINRNKNLMKGDKLYLDIKDKEYYLLNPCQLHMDLLDQKKKKIGEINIADIIIRILKAHYNGYQLDINVVSFDSHAYYPHAEIEIVPKK
jgi:hypothetical protein